MEIEEVYGDVVENDRIVNREMKFFNYANAYVFPTNLLNLKINKNNLPFIIIHGIYDYYDNNNLKFNDNRIHCVYSGTFDVNKGGAETAALTAKFLSNNYHIHILGFGNKEDTDHIKKIINELSNISACKISYDGLKTGDDYILFLQMCDIGLCTQNPNARFNNTSFPSKILSYMSCGLRVVSIRTDVVLNSYVGEYISFYNNHNSKDVASAIVNTDFNNNYNPKEILSNLNFAFINDLKKLISQIKCDTNT